MANYSIAFIGAGNMASSIIGGLVQKGLPARKITASDPSTSHLDGLKQQYGINTTDSNANAVKDADVIVLAVKPQVMKLVCGELQSALNENTRKKPLIISIAAGIPMESYSRWLGSDLAIVRIMPNTPALIRCGAAGLYANENVSDQQRQQATDIAGACGLALWVDSEDLIDAVTAVSGSGPAYYFLVMEAMIDAGVNLGLTPDTARQLTLQTALGAAQMAVSSDVPPSQLRENVTSKGGTTAEALRSFEDNKLRAIFTEAMQACADRGKEMARELGAD
ncbi:MAG: pyrroline-5-carboxylate reductase [Cellvibrionaceae bacterium]